MSTKKKVTKRSTTKKPTAVVTKTTKPGNPKKGAASDVTVAKVVAGMLTVAQAEAFMKIGRAERDAREAAKADAPPEKKAAVEFHPVVLTDLRPAPINGGLVVQGTNGKWLFGDRRDEAKLRSMPGTYKSIDEASKAMDAAARDDDETKRRIALAQPVAVVVVKALDGRWVFGLDRDEAALRARATGDYATSTAASEAAAKDHDIIINTGAPPARKSKAEAWGRLTAPSYAATESNPQETSSTTKEGTDMTTKAKAKTTTKKSTTKAATASTAKKTPLVTPAATTATKVKSTAPSAASAKRGRATGDVFADQPMTGKITVLSNEHAFVKGSIREKAFLAILKAKTVADAKKATGGDPWHLRTAVKEKKVKVA